MASMVTSREGMSCISWKVMLMKSSSAETALNPAICGT